MLVRPFLRLLSRRQLVPMLRANALYRPFYTLSYLAAAKSCGLVDRLHERAVSFDELASDFGCNGPKPREALNAWLQFGVRAGVLRADDDGYSLRGLARVLSRPENDSTMALAQEVATLHYRLLLETPGKLRRGELWQLADQDSELTARSSRALEAFQIEAIERTFPASGEVRLLEIGCGSAHYIRHVATRNPQLTALGLELDARVAALARRNVEHWGLQDRVRIEAGDIRLRSDRGFDIATLYNNIYYFELEERRAVLAHVRQCLSPGGFLLLTTCCQGGNLGIEALNLWGATTQGAGPLPSVREMVGQLREAGFASVETIRLIPGDSFHAFRAEPMS